MLVVTVTDGQTFEFIYNCTSLGTVRVSKLRADRVRVAFDMPNSVEIWRGETAPRVVANRAAKVPNVG